MSVLVFEDDPLLLDLYERALQGFGLVRSFARAEDGIQELPQATLLVTDLQLPGMSGLELLEHRDPELPTVVVSGASDLLARVRPAPHLRILAKPFRLAALREAISQATLA